MSLKRFVLQAAAWLVLCSFSSIDPPKINITRPLPADERQVLERIIQYLEQHSLAPFFSGGSCEYVHLNYIKDAQGTISHAYGLITQENRASAAMFSIEQSWWSGPSVKLMYLTTDELLLAPLLFNDIVMAAQGFLFQNPSEALIFIERRENASLPPETREQDWIFIGKNVAENLTVVLTEDGDGGTYFTIKRP